MTLDLRQPGGRAFWGELRADQVRINGCNAPVAVTLERDLQLGLTDRVRARVRSTITEAQEIETRTRSGHRGQTGDICAPFDIVECVEQSAVDDGVERTPQTSESERIGFDELDIDTSPCSPFARDRHRHRSHIEADDAYARGSDATGVVARTASGIEHRADECMLINQPRDRRLRCTEIPRCRAVGVRRVPRPTGEPFVAGGSPTAVRIAGFARGRTAHDGLATLAQEITRGPAAPVGFGVMWFGVLGPFEARDDAGTPLPTPPPKQKRLLAVLLASTGGWVSTDRLIDVLWAGDPPRSARSNLHVYVYRLRGALGEDRIEHQDDGYRLPISPEETDVGQFESLVAQGAHHEALALWRGEPYVGVTDMEIVREEAARLVELRLSVLEARIDDDLEQGLHGQLVSELSALVAKYPLRERFSGQLMRALYRSGRASEALEVYRDLRSHMVEELGTEPGKPLRDLQQAILAEDPALEASTSPHAPTRAVPAELPPAIGSFTGRDDEMERIGSVLTGSRGSSVPVVNISGPGGVGKSALAVQAAHRVAEQFPDGQLYINMQGATPGVRPLDPHEGIGRLLRSLGDADFDTPHDVEEASARLRTLTSDRCILFVLDDVVDEAQVRPLLPGGVGCAVLITSRGVLTSLDGMTPHQLGALTDDEAIDLLGRVSGTERLSAEPDSGRRLARLCDRLPLALCIAGAKLNRRPKWPISELVLRMTDEQRRLDELELPDRAVRASIAVSSNDLDAETARMFRLLGLLAGADIGVPVAAALADRSEAQAERMLDQLTDAQLIDSPAPGRYRLHDLLRLFARDQAYALESAKDRDSAVRRTLHCYLATGITAALVQTPESWRREFLPETLRHPGQPLADESEAGAWLAAESLNILAVARQAAALPDDGPLLAAAFAAVLFAPMNTRGRWYELRELIELGLAVLPDDALHDHRALLLNDLGWIYALIGDADKALAPLEHALGHWRETGHRRGEATTLRVFARALGQIERGDEALEYVRRALDIYRDLDIPIGQVDCLIALGLETARQGRFEESIAAHEQGIALAEAGDDLWQVGVLHGNLADVYRRASDPHRAIIEFEKALQLDRESGNAGTYFEAEHLWCLGIALNDVGDDAGARRCWDHAAHILCDLRLIGADELSTLLDTPFPETPDVIVRQL